MQSDRVLSEQELQSERALSNITQKVAGYTLPDKAKKAMVKNLEKSYQEEARQSRNIKYGSKSKLPTFKDILN